MLLKKITGLLFFSAVLVFFGCERGSEQTPVITVAAAANMQFAMEKLTEVFSKKTGIKCQTVIGSSGKLTAQIKEGAPFDIFAAANMKYPGEIFESGMAVEPPKIYAYGKLVLWTADDDISADLKTLSEPHIRHIAVANPQTAPYGAAAEEVLKRLNLLQAVRHKLVFGESISQTNRFIISKAAEIGFTSASVVLSPQMKNKGNRLDIPSDLYTPIAQGAVIVKRKNRDSASAKKFYDFLSSAEAREILKDFGYSINE